MRVRNLRSPRHEIRTQKDSWDKLKIIILSVGTVLIPVILFWATQDYTKAIKNRGVEGRFVELAVGILSQKPSEEQENLRVWAVEILNNYSGVKLNSAAAADLIDRAFIDISHVDSLLLDNIKRMTEAYNSIPHD